MGELVSWVVFTYQELFLGEHDVQCVAENQRTHRTSECSYTISLARKFFLFCMYSSLQISSYIIANITSMLAASKLWSQFFPNLSCSQLSNVALLQLLHAAPLFAEITSNLTSGCVYPCVCTPMTSVSMPWCQVCLPVLWMVSGTRKFLPSTVQKVNKASVACCY